MPANSDDYRPYLDNGRQGFVYLLTSNRLPNLVKIGATRKHPLQRAKELGAGTGVPEPFLLAYFRDYSDCFTAESLIHQTFEVTRVNENREFFEVDIDEVIEYMDGLAQSSEYKELVSEGIIGGTHEQRPVARRGSMDPPTPLAELFATFPDDGSPRELTIEEQAKCRALGV